jgi:integrase
MTSKKANHDGLYLRGNTVWLRVKNGEGKWCGVSSGIVIPAGASTAERNRQWDAAARVREQLVSGAAPVAEAAPAPFALTVEAYSKRWLEQRSAFVKTWKADKSRLDMHVLPRIGKVPLADIRPKHIADLVYDLRAAGKIAPKTIHNVYGVVCALFREALIQGLLDANPCILTVHHLGPKKVHNLAADEHRPFTKDQLRLLLSDAVPEDRRVAYALGGLAGLRHGEIAGLTWAHYETSHQPLGRILVATSYDSGRTKTGVPRLVPVHPALASLLESWKSDGWVQQMARQPKPEDLLVPLPATGQGPAGRMRRPQGSLWYLHNDLKTLGVEEHCFHDLRHTFISLLRSDGATKDILGRITHSPSREVLDGYTSYEWEVLCREVLKLRITFDQTRTAPSGLATDFATRFATSGLSKNETPGNLSASEGFFLRRVWDLNP